uniref:CLAVATA3/ESR (CLE)-related protein 5-like n=1 Tax=Nicotiana sylvestris TaxID=4096 RepID=A0A1U7YS55_NICSY|nr:PREDICTED: CLAVATA3/ESR (CLE)-related protein 5-like [Nicotiana sylvestris]
MANSKSILSSIFVLLLIFSSHVNISVSRATTYRGLESMRRKIDSKQILSELMNDFGKNLEQNHRRVMKGKDRVAPGGPDPQHH